MDDPPRAYAVYDARVVFTVNLEAGEVESAELYRDSLTHFDTGLSFRPPPAAWLALQKRVRQTVEREPTAAPLRWNSDGD